MYEPERVWYEKKQLPGPLELVSLSGFILKSETWPFHLHAVFGDNTLSAYAGHLFDAEIVTFIEMTLLLQEHAVHRTLVKGLPEMSF
jgi:predicted DNA-binding protein with PD1-like motif